MLGRCGRLVQPSSTCRLSWRSLAGRNVVRELADRGLLDTVFPRDSEPELVRLLESKAGPATVYAGFDPTAPSLHIGNLLGRVGTRTRGGSDVVLVLPTQIVGYT